MLKYLVPLLVTLSAATSYQNNPYSRGPPSPVASQSQIKFAEKNNYDDTGPGAKKPEVAYNTFKTLDDALIAYLDDPDTKLPEQERAKAVQKLLQNGAFAKPGPMGHYTRNLNFASDKFQLPPQEQLPNPYQTYDSNIYHHQRTENKVFAPQVQPVISYHGALEQKQEFRVPKVLTVKNSPLSLAHYTRDPELKSTFEEYNPYPLYSYSYGVLDKTTGDEKQVAESGNAGNVRGFYSFIDATGKQHTIHYTADDAKGYRASIAQHA